LACLQGYSALFNELKGWQNDGELHFVAKTNPRAIEFAQSFFDPVHTVRNPKPSFWACARLRSNPFEGEFDFVFIDADKTQLP